MRVKAIVILLICLFQKVQNQENYIQLELIGPNDDCYEKNGLIIHNTVFLDLGFGSVSGFRFKLNTQPGYSIDSARLLLVYNWGNGPATFRVTLEDSLNAATFGDLASRNRLANSVVWAIDDTQGSYGRTFLSPDLAPLISQITSRNGWVSGNHIAIILESIVPSAAYPFEVVSYEGSVNTEAYYGSKLIIEGSGIMETSSGLGKPSISLISVPDPLEEVVVPLAPFIECPAPAVPLNPDGSEKIPLLIILDDLQAKYLEDIGIEIAKTTYDLGVDLLVNVIPNKLS